MPATNSPTADGSQRAGRRAVCVILAAGEGKRMASTTPKALHKVGGRPMLHHVLETAHAIAPARIVLVVGAGADAVADAARTAVPDVVVVEQTERRGTGHAVAQARAALEGVERAEDDVFVLYGDTPLIRPETLRAMIEARASGAALVALGFHAADPGGYGRLMTDADGGLDRIVEHRDASPAERAVTLCNSGVICVSGDRLFPWLDEIGDDNAAGEIYLTDIVAIARRAGADAVATVAPEAEVLGVNSRAELARAEAAFQDRARAVAMESGATLIAPESVFFSYDTRLGRDVTIGPFVVFGPGVSVEDEVEIRAFSHLEGALVGRGAIVGPFARLRPGARLGDNARIGNFVEVKNADVAEGAKINHLSYVGDATIGSGANIGAGVITCNYDGFLKHQTTIGAGAFIGSNAALVAPVEIGDGAVVGAGSTVTTDVEPDALAVARARQTTKPGHAVRLRAMLAARAAEDNS